jgi:exonuclease III
MSLAPKIDELREVSKQIDVDLICITESWLQNHIHDVFEISGYNIVRRDRYQGEHGGVCVYVKNAIKYDILSELVSNDFEAIWLKLKPLRLPRGISCIILCNLYHPPKGNDQDLINYLYEALTTIEIRLTNCGIIILGDFNKLNLSRLKNSFKLCQIVKFPTRGSSSLDLIPTNMKQFYDEPTKRPPFGLSDHLSVEIQPLK